MKEAKGIQTSVDPVIFTVFDNRLHILLVKRSIEPFADFWALPGGFVDTEMDVDLLASAMRKLKEKTNVDAAYLEQVWTEGGAHRDPRGWSVTVVYFALIARPDTLLAASRGASEVRWEQVVEGDAAVSVALAFDHDKLVKIAVERLRNKVSYTSIAAHLLPQPFTFLDLQEIHEVILGRKVEKKSLMRRYLGADILEEVSEVRKEGRMRPAQLYRLRNPEQIHYFVRTTEGPREE